MKNERRYTKIEVNIDDQLFTFTVPTVCNEEDFKDAFRIVYEGIFSDIKSSQE